MSPKYMFHIESQQEKGHSGDGLMRAGVLPLLIHSIWELVNLYCITDRISPMLVGCNPSPLTQSFVIRFVLTRVLKKWGCPGVHGN